MGADKASLTDTQVISFIFQIQAGSKFGTGFLIDNVHMLTALHVVKNCVGGNVVVRRVLQMQNHQEIQEYQATVVATLDQWDVAVLRLNQPFSDASPLHLKPATQVNSSSASFRTYGFARNFGAGWHRGRVVGELSNGKYDVDFDTQYPDSLGGLSGGPVFLVDDASYTIAGIIVEHGPNNLQKGRIVPATSFFAEVNRVMLSWQKNYPNCFVVLSETDALTSDPYKLVFTINSAKTLLQRDDPTLVTYLEPMECASATNLVSSQETFEDGVRKLCHAQVAIFDITDYEPAVMLLLGIRSVVRRGITIASLGGKFIVGDAINFPFNIKEVNIISHSERQRNQAKRPAHLISEVLQQGISQLSNLPQYLDLPTFDAIRNLPPGFREPDVKNVLVLCPFSQHYQEHNWKDLLDYVSLYLPREGVSLVRSLDVVSPRLVSHTIYELIRRVVLCLVDWTELRPNVFFEFGVRLAVASTRKFTVSIMESRHRWLIEHIAENYDKLAQHQDELIKLITLCTGCDSCTQDTVERYLHIAKQCRYLLQLFQPLPYTCSTSPNRVDWPRFDGAEYEEMSYYFQHRELEGVSIQNRRGLAPYFTYEVIQQEIDPEQEVISTPVYLELLRAANLFDVDSSDGRKAVLYPEREELKSKVEIGITERLLAAWYFIRHEYSNEDILQNKGLQEVARTVAVKLKEHIGLDSQRADLIKQIDDFIVFILEGEVQ